MLEFIINLFLLPWNIFGWILKYFFSGVVWFTLFYGIYYFFITKEWNYTYKFRSPFTREKKPDIDDEDFLGV